MCACVFVCYIETHPHIALGDIISRLSHTTIVLRYISSLTYPKFLYYWSLVRRNALNYTSGLTPQEYISLQSSRFTSYIHFTPLLKLHLIYNTWFHQGGFIVIMTSLCSAISHVFCIPTYIINVHKTHSMRASDDVCIEASFNARFVYVLKVMYDVRTYTLVSPTISYSVNSSFSVTFSYITRVTRVS